jgi:uncharacterized protein (DUF362 family)
MKPVVSLIKYEDLDSVAQVISMCDGFSNLKPNDRVLLKPNICTAQSGFFPPYGTVTTTKVMEGTIVALKEFGINDIAIGEGTVLDELGTNTKQGYRWIHLNKLQKKYGVKLLDFNKGPHKKIVVKGVPMNLAEAALDTDFFINLPVLKTHIAARVSLSSKNLKGCLSMASKKYFHGKDNSLHYHIARLMETVPQHLVIIDGIYVMDYGPDASTGTAHPKGVILSSKDFFAADCVGTRLLGGEPKDVEHLKLYAERHKRVDVLNDTGAIEVLGERVEDNTKFIPWLAITGKDLKDQGHTGFEIKEIRSTVCSGCYANLTGPTLLLSALSKKKDFNDLVVIIGKNLKEDRDTPRTLLFGKCAINENKHLENATRLAGCPPSFLKAVFYLINQMKGRMSRLAFYRKLLPYFVKSTLGIGMLPLERYEIYKNNPDFDIDHFRVS